MVCLENSIFTFPTHVCIEATTCSFIKPRPFYIESQEYGLKHGSKQWLSVQKCSLEFQLAFLSILLIVKLFVYSVLHFSYNTCWEGNKTIQMVPLRIMTTECM